MGSKVSYPVKKYTGLDEEEFFSKSDIGVSNKSYKLIINPSSGMEANGVFFLPGITGVEREVSSLTNEVVDVTGSRMWVPGEYVVSSDGVISRTISSLEQYKKLVSEESGYDHFSYGVFRFLTGNLSGANKDVQIAVTENFINAFKNELVKEVTYKVYSDNPETKALEEVASGDCSVKKDIMQINCNLNGLQLSEPGFYVYQIRVKFNELELLHFIDDYHFNELLEKNCGVEPMSDFNGDIVDAICRIDVMGVYNEYEKSYTPEAKQAMENLNSSINSQINEFENNVPPKIKGLIERVLVAKNESFSSLKSKFQPNNVDLKHTNAAILNGYPIYGFIIVGDPAKGIEDISKIEVSDEFVEVTEPALGGQSVVYYDKLLNARIFSGAIIPTPQELKEDVESKKGLVEGEKSDSPSSAKGGATITWSNLLPTTDYEISFAPVNGKSLKMTFTKSKWSGVRYVDVLVNNSPVNCYNSPYAGLANYFGGKNTLVLGWFETEEHCDYPVDGRYVVDTKLSSEGDYYKLEITSPLIPTSCSGQTISATNQNINLSC
ncbi:MAG TPA: hypothetical protein PKK60_01540 [archaeon]|nr:hypothetical protein [archaeon]